MKAEPGDESYVAFLFLVDSPEAEEARKIRDAHDARIAKEKALQQQGGDNAGG